MTPAELKTEINTGPLAAELAPFVAAGDDLTVARILNRQDIANKKSVPLDALANYLSEQGILANIADAASDGANLGHAAARKAVATLRLSRELGIRAINMQRASNQGLINNLVSAGLMTVGQANGLKALADILASRAEIAFGQSVSPTDVSETRRV